MWGFGLLAFVASVPVAVLTADPASPVPQAWLLTTIAFTWLSLTWPRPTLPATPLTWITLGLVALGGLVAAWLLDVSWSEVLRTGVATPLHAAAMCAAYQWGRGLLGSPRRRPNPQVAPWRNAWSGEWAPTRARDLMSIAISAFLTAFAVIPLGGMPGLYLGSASGQEIWDWVIRTTVTVFIGASTTLITFGTWSRKEVGRALLISVSALLVSVVILIWVFERHALEMAWLVLLPTLYVSLQARVWATSTYCLFLGLATLTILPASRESLGQDPVLPLTDVVYILIAACVLVALSTALLQESRSHLLAALDAESARTARNLKVLRTAFESMHDGFLVIGPDARVRMHNSAAALLLGRPIPERPPNGSWVNYLGLTRVDGTAFADDDELLSTEYLALQRPGQERRVLQMRYTPLTQNLDEGVMMTFVDVTDHQQRLKDLSGFAAVVAHDLRAPLTSLEGWLEMAEESLGMRRLEGSVALLARARASNRRMREVIDDWLRHTVELEGELVFTDVALTALVNEVVAERAGAGPQDVWVDTPHAVRADRAMVRQVLDNVVSNATKYHRHGELPQVQITSTNDVPGWVRVEVADHGVGLPPGEEESVFEEYRRGSAHHAGFEGSGLGLTLCRRIVERHGGTIRARNNADGGATITFTLPAANGVPAPN